MKRILTVVVSMLLFAAVEASVAAAATITIPAGDGAVISGVTVRGCDRTDYGYSVGPGSVSVAGWGGGCGSTSLSGAQIAGASFTRTLQIYMHDSTCGAVYYSDGSGRANHALVSGSGPFQVDINDAGGGSCGGAGNNSLPARPGGGNFSATVTIRTPPTVTLSVPAATGTNGYFDANDLTNNHGSIAVGVSASDNSGSGVSNIACTENGNPVSLSGVSGVNTATMSGTITLTADGAYAISCIASDNRGETGSTGSANVATYQIDTTAPTLSLPNHPVRLDASSPAGATLSSYAVSASDPDAGDVPTVTCSPAAPHTFPIGATTVSCTATDRAGNTATGSFEVTVQPVPTTVTLSTPQATVFGQSAPVMATVSDADHSSPMGAVQFTRNGAALGSPVPVTGGTATSPRLTTAAAPGSYQVGATFEPTQATVYATASAIPVTSVVSRAWTTASLHVWAKSISTTVAPVGPGAGTPTGSVTFSVGGKVVGSASLSGGIATLDSEVPPGAAHVVAASYGGDVDFTGSSASTSRNDPSITAQLASSRPRSRDGWYSTPVKVKFTCTAHGAALTGLCPSAVTLSGNGGGQSVTRTITATDGGAATVVVSPINIDRTRPHVSVAGVRSAATYMGTPPTPRCTATDSLSGIVSCVLRVHKHVSGRGLDITTVSYTAIATDRAGSTRRVSGTYRALGIYIDGVAYRRGEFQVKLGRTYTIVVTGTRTNPRYIDASPGLLPPRGLDNPFHPVGRGVWVQAVTLTGAMRRYRDWNLGIKIGNVLHIVPIYQL